MFYHIQLLFITYFVIKFYRKLIYIFIMMLHFCCFSWLLVFYVDALVSFMMIASHIHLQHCENLVVLSTINILQSLYYSNSPRQNRTPKDIVRHFDFYCWNFIHGHSP